MIKFKDMDSEEVKEQKEKYGLLVYKKFNEIFTELNLDFLMKKDIDPGDKLNIALNIAINLLREQIICSIAYFQATLGDKVDKDEMIDDIFDKIKESCKQEPFLKKLKNKTEAAEHLSALMNILNEEWGKEKSDDK